MSIGGGLVIGDIGISSGIREQSLYYYVASS
jgi:hypothetical protein